MVERRALTPDFLDAVEKPMQGERWVADTQVRGFGLRLWSSRSGSGAAFAVRTSDKNRKSIRRTFDPDGPDANLRSWQRMLSSEETDRSNGIPLRFFLEDARRWAKKVVAQAKGLVPTNDEQESIGAKDQKNRSHFKHRMEELTLGRAAEIIISNGPSRGWSEPYGDRMNKLFFSNVPPELQETQIGKIKPDDIRRVIASDNVKPANARALRSLLHQILLRVHELGGPPLGLFLERNDPGLFDRTPSIAEHFISGLDRRDFNHLFDMLENEKDKWPQLYCLRLSFELSAPFSQLMAARWDQISKDIWFPFAPGGRKYWEYKWCRINSQTYNVLERAHRLGIEDFGGSRFWFPSRSSVGGHIKNTDRNWRAILREVDWPEAPVSLYAKRYQQLRNYGALWPEQKWAREQLDIAAKLSKFSELY